MAAGASPRAVADEIRLPGAVVRRMWHTAGDLLGVRSADTPSGATLWLQVDGSSTMTLDDAAEVSLPASSAAVWGRRQPVRASFPAPGAWIQVETDAIVGPLASGVRWRAAEVGPAHVSLAWSAAAGMCNVLLNDARGVHPSLVPSVVLLLESTVELVCRDVAGAEVARRRPRPSSALYDRARAEIVRSRSDRSLTIDALAARLGVTRPHLSRVFRRHGTSPLRVLRDERVALARRLEATRHEASREDIARWSGFSSVRAMREARRNRPALRGADDVDTRGDTAETGALADRAVDGP